MRTTLLVVIIASTSLLAQTPPQPNWTAVEAETLKHFQAIVKMNTTDPPGGEKPVVDYLKQVLEAEGIPCSAGYGFSLPAQPLFRNKAFGPYLAGVREWLDYRQARCPNSDLVCTQSIWLEHAMLLGTRDDMDDIAAAFEKIHRHRDQLEGR